MISSDGSIETVNSMIIIEIINWDIFLMISGFWGWEVLLVLKIYN